MIAIIDYGMGNLKSVFNAFKQVAPEADIKVTSNPTDIKQAHHVVFPGQGAMPDCIRELDERNLRSSVIEAAKTKPFLSYLIHCCHISTKNGIAFSDKIESPSIL